MKRGEPETVEEGIYMHLAQLRAGTQGNKALALVPHKYKTPRPAF